LFFGKLNFQKYMKFYKIFEELLQNGLILLFFFNSSKKLNFNSLLFFVIFIIFLNNIIYKKLKNLF